MLAAYSVARIGQTGLAFGHVNKIGEVRPLPAVVLGYVCGYVPPRAQHTWDIRTFGHGDNS